MSALLIHNVRLVLPEMGIMSGNVRVAGAQIAAVATGTPDPIEDSIDGGGRLITAGLIDVHTHGVHTYCYDNGAEDLLRAASVLPRYGVTSVVPTMVPNVNAAYMRLLDELAGAIPASEGAQILGLHLEGPFVAITGAACETRDGDLALLDELITACRHQVRVMSISPEVRNIIPVIERLVELNITPFITHTRASVDECAAAIAAGARHATHFYDVFPLPPETDPGVRPVGVVETILADARATCDFICDGIHVHPMAIRAAVAAKGWRGVTLITDSSFGAGMAPGDYATPWGYGVRIAPGGAPRIADEGHPMRGCLAGSALTMNKGITNLMNWLDLPPEQVWAMGSLNPARVIGAAHKGAMAPGLDADLVLWDETEDGFAPAMTWVGGVCRYDRTRSTAFS